MEESTPIIIRDTNGNTLRKTTIDVAPERIAWNGVVARTEPNAIVVTINVEGE